MVANIGNAGTRPADDALVRFEAKGNVLLIAQHESDEDDDEAEKQADSVQLPRAPVPPKGTWKTRRYALDTLDMSRFGLERNYFGVDWLPNTVHQRDPNGLYWRGGRSKHPAAAFELTCDQWRHAQDEHEFVFRVMTKLEPGTHSGVVEAQVHAANLTTPAVVRVPVRIGVERSSCLSIAQGLVEDMSRPGRSQ